MMGERNRRKDRVRGKEKEREGDRHRRDREREPREEKRHSNPSAEGSNLPFMRKAVKNNKASSSENRR